MSEKTINNLEELENFCVEFSKQLKPGDIVCLTGDLGAGKTTFVASICEALGIDDNVQSPTFNIQLQYKNDKICINHFDLYRLEKTEDLEDIGFYEALEGEAITFIEWAEIFKDQMPKEAIWIEIKMNSKDNRTFIIK